MKKFNTGYRLQDTEYRIQNTVYRPPGFTLIELLIVIAITSVLSTLGIGYYANQQRTKSLETTAQEIASYLKYAQQKSISQEQGLQWGVHFENPSSGADFYALYTGTSYSTPVETKYLPQGIEFQNPSQGNSIDVAFAKLTGFLTGGSYQQIIIRDSSGNAKNILTCQQGIITYDADLSTCGGIDTTPPSISGLVAYNMAYGSYVSSPFDLSATVTEEQGGVLSCEYTINNGLNWYSASLSGMGPSYTCNKTGISASDGSSLSLNMRATSSGGVGTGSSISRIVDAIAPNISDNWTDNWTATSPVTVTITSTDARSGVASTKYCVDTANSCYPSSSYSSAISVSCASGSVCTQYVRYAAWDNVNNASVIASKTVRQDLLAPVNGTLTATSGNQQVSLSWSGFSDSGSGLATSNTYKLVYQTGSSPSSCSVGTQIYLGTGTSYTHTGLTNGTTYYYRVCAYDALGNISTGATASATPISCSCGSWSACDSCSYSSTCATSGSGTQTRTCTPSGCSTESQSCTCTRSTDGTSCGTTQYGSWSTCSGCNQSRSVTTYTCSSGSCVSNTSSQTQACGDGTSCGTTQYGSWSACSGCNQSRSVTTYTCSSGSCTSNNSTETQACGDGTICQTGSCSCSCNYSSVCANTGTLGTCVQTDIKCAGGDCDTLSTWYGCTWSGSCTRNTNGMPCGTDGHGIQLYCCSGSCNCY